MKKNLKTNNVLGTYGVSSRVIQLINGSIEVLPADLNWLEVAYLYTYADRLIPQLKPWIEKMNTHFAQENPEAQLIVALAVHYEELSSLLINEVVHIKPVLPLHYVHSLVQLLPKLDPVNRKLALDWIMDQSKKTKDADNRLNCLLYYYDNCSENDKLKAINELVEVAKLLREYQLRDLYKKIPDQRIADLWLKSLDNEREFRTVFRAALITKQDAFFEKAKLPKIIGVDSDIYRLIRETWNEISDGRVLDIWLHAIQVFHQCGCSGAVEQAIDVYRTTQDMRFLSFAKEYSNSFSQKVALYKVSSDDILLESLKFSCADFGQAREALLLTGDNYFLTAAEKYLSEEEWKYAAASGVELYQKLSANAKHQTHRRALKKFLEDNIVTIWEKCRSTNDKEGLLSMLAS